MLVSLVSQADGGLFKSPNFSRFRNKLALTPVRTPGSSRGNQWFSNPHSGYSPRSRSPAAANQDRHPDPCTRVEHQPKRDQCCRTTRRGLDGAHHRAQQGDNAVERPSSKDDPKSVPHIGMADALVNMEDPLSRSTTAEARCRTPCSAHIKP